MLRRGLLTFNKTAIPQKFRLFSTIAEQVASEVDSNVSDQVKRTNYLLDDHAPVYGEDLQQMLDVTGIKDMDDLVKQIVPTDVFDKTAMHFKGDSLSEPIPVDLLHTQFKQTLSQNKMNKTYIGEGFYGTLIPHVIERNFLSNPGWYTAYTPYQAEISQGRLAGLMCYQEICRTLTGFEIAGASLLDEASAASEAMLLSYNVARGKQSKYIVDESVFPNSLKVIQTNAKYLGIDVVVTDASSLTAEDMEGCFGVLFQNPDNLGRVKDLTGAISTIKGFNSKATVSVGTDLASLLLHKTPASMGADVAFGNSQRFGVPLGFGGPAAAFFATHSKHIRKLPGRIIGLSVDSQGNPAYRMALQTREQHIRREKATSNICTAQALLANMAGFYCIYHGEEGLKNISQRINTQTKYLAQTMIGFGYDLVESNNIFDTLVFNDEK